MSHHRRRTGICVIRVEEQGSRYLITLRSNPDIEGSPTGSVGYFVETELALADVRRFLEQFVNHPLPKLSNCSYHSE